MLFNNEKELEDFLLPKLKNALIKAQDKVHRVVDMYMQRFYADYNPVWYKRTYELMHSLVKGEIKKNGNGYIAKVYFDLDYLYKTGSKPSGEQVMDAAAYGGHGAKGLKVVYSSGEDAWYTPLEIIDAEAIETLKQMLISEGIPIK